MVPINLPKGFRIKDKEILDDQPIGKGGFSYVFKAWKPDVENYYAVKILYPQVLQETTDVEERNRILQIVMNYFETEQKILIKFKHKNIVKIEDFGILEDASGNSYPYYIMEFIGDSIKGKNCKIDKAIERKYDIDEAIDLIIQACDALDKLHNQGIIHRDIKPANLLLQDGDTIKVADFGVARIMEESGSMSGFTVVMTPHYGSPEQESGDTLQPNSDIYALGKTLYTMITEEYPPKRQIKSLPGIEPESSKSKAILKVLQDATERDPEKRKYATASDFKKDLKKVKQQTFSIDKEAEDITIPEIKPGHEFNDKQKPNKQKKSGSKLKPVLLIAAIVALTAILYTQVPEIKSKTDLVWSKVVNLVKIEHTEQPDPVQAETHFEQGLNWFDAQNLEQAREEFEKAIGFYPDSANYHAYLGLVYSELNNGNEAIAAWQKAVALDTGKIEYKINLGKTYSQFGKSESAINIWNEVLKQRPGDETVKVLITLEKKKLK